MQNDWNVKRYENGFDFVPGYGVAVTELLTVPKGSLVVDLGCGNGKLSKRLSDMGYNVLGVDASQKMLEAARRDYPDISFMHGDACTFSLPQKADAIFSNAVFHWIDGHRALAENLARNLRQGGELVFEFGGKGCAQTVHNALARAFGEYGLSYVNRFNFKTIGEFAPLLESCGFRVEQALLFDRPTEQAGEDGLENWIKMFIGEPFNGVEEQTRQSIIKRAVELCRGTLYRESKWFVDYVRLRMYAVKE